MPPTDKETVRLGYNAIAARYLAARAKDSADVQLLRVLVERLPPAARVLDAGCGAGVPITHLLAQRFAVTGLDFAEAQLRLARAHVPSARFVCQDLAHLGLADEVFDAVCSYYAIIHIPRAEHQAVVQGLYRVLRPGGLALLCLGANDLERDFEADYYGAPMHWSHFDRPANLRLLAASGFGVIWEGVVPDAESPGSGHLFALAHKPPA